jgi:hypothetical protein
MKEDLKLHLKNLKTKPRSGFVRQLNRDIIKHSQRIGYSKPSLISTFGWAIKAGTLATITALVASTAYAYASPKITRNSPFYFVKRIGESVELAAASSPEKQVDVYLRLTNRRIAELQELANDGIIDITTATEVKANSQNAAVIARAIPENNRPAVNKKIAEASRTNVESLTSVSVSAQVKSKKPVIIVKDDAAALATDAKILTPENTSNSEGSIEASTPRDGAVVGSELVLSPSKVNEVAGKDIEVKTNDPEIEALNDAIESSTELAKLDMDPEEIEKDDQEIKDEGVFNTTPAYNPERYKNPFKTMSEEEYAELMAAEEAAKKAEEEAGSEEIINDGADSGDTTPSDAEPGAPIVE